MSYRNRRHPADMEPREITARFDSVCPETGKTIKKGEACIYYPRSKQAYHTDSQQAADYRSQAQADSYGLLDANWQSQPERQRKQDNGTDRRNQLRNDKARRPRSNPRHSKDPA